MAKKDDVPEVLTIEERLLRVQEKQLELQERALTVQTAQIKQTAPKSNTAGPKISVFNPRGEKDFPMSELKCEVHMPFRLTTTGHSLDREEVELMNLIEPGDDYEVELTDGSTQRVCVIGTRNHATGTLEKLVFKGPRDESGVYSALYSNETRQVFPSMKSMLRQMLGARADDVISMRAELAAIISGDLAVSVGA